MAPFTLSQVDYNRYVKMLGQKTVDQLIKAGVWALQVPAPKTNPSTFKVAFSPLDLAPIARFQRYVYNNNQDDPTTLVARCKASIDLAGAKGCRIWAQWDARSSSYNGIPTDADAPKWREVFAYAASKKMVYGGLIPNNRYFVDADGNWQCDVEGYVADTIGWSRQMRDTFGWGFAYLDANPQMPQTAVCRVAAALEDDRLAGKPRVLLNAELWNGAPAERAAGNVALLWYDAPAKGWLPPITGFDATLLFYHTGSMTQAQIDWVKANRNKCSVIVDTWPGNDQPIPDCFR